MANYHQTLNISIVLKQPLVYSITVANILLYSNEIEHILDYILSFPQIPSEKARNSSN